MTCEIAVFRLSRIFVYSAENRLVAGEKASFDLFSDIWVIAFDKPITGRHQENWL
jgi:hypothetical protein